MISDQIGDLLTRIRNAVKVKKESSLVAFSKINMNILKVMKEAGYIQDYEKTKQDVIGIKNILKVFFKYKNRVSVIQKIKRISKPGLRIYSQSDNLPKVLNGIGIAIISTSQGVMTARQARRNRLGGEILAHMW